MNTILWSRKAQKQVLQLPKEDAVNIHDRVDILKNFPGSECGDIKFLKNHQYDYRLRVGRYRVMFNYKDGIEVVNIEEVKKRDERTY